MKLTGKITRETEGKAKIIHEDSEIRTFVEFNSDFEFPFSIRETYSVEEFMESPEPKTITVDRDAIIALAKFAKIKPEEL